MPNSMSANLLRNYWPNFHTKFNHWGTIYHRALFRLPLVLALELVAIKRSDDLNLADQLLVERFQLARWNP